MCFALPSGNYEESHNMRALRIFAASFVLTGVGFGLALAADPITIIPDGVESATPGDRGECANPIAHHDGTDDSPGSGFTLGGPSAPYWYLGVRHTPPAGNYQVDAVQFFSEFWVTPGNVTVHVYEIDNPANAADATIFISAGGDYEVNYSAPICVDSDFGVVFCPDPNVWGVLGEDSSPPIDNTSYQNNTDAGGCELINIVGADLLITSCVTPCGPTPVEEATWGTVKALYR
jgi:hypothetical protein